MWFKNRRAKYRKTQRCSSPPPHGTTQRDNPILSPSLAVQQIANSNSNLIINEIDTNSLLLRQTSNKLDPLFLTRRGLSTPPPTEYSKSVWNPFALRGRGVPDMGALASIGTGGVAEKRRLMIGGEDTYPLPHLSSTDLYKKYQQVTTTAYPPQQHCYNSVATDFISNNSGSKSAKWHHPLPLNMMATAEQHLHAGGRRMFISWWSAHAWISGVMLINVGED